MAVVNAYDLESSLLLLLLPWRRTTRSCWRICALEEHPLAREAFAVVTLLAINAELLRRIGDWINAEYQAALAELNAVRTIINFSGPPTGFGF
jgi:hypothetical protein